MSSKQAVAKAAQGYTTAVKNCGNCAHMTSERAIPQWMQKRNAEYERNGFPFTYRVETHGTEKNFRCGIGGFAVKKTATCAQHEPKATEEQA